MFGPGPLDDEMSLGISRTATLHTPDVRLKARSRETRAASPLRSPAARAATSIFGASARRHLDVEHLVRQPVDEQGHRERLGGPVGPGAGSSMAVDQTPGGVNGLDTPAAKPTASPSSTRA